MGVGWDAGGRSGTGFEHSRGTHRGPAYVRVSERDLNSIQRVSGRRPSPREAFASAASFSTVPNAPDTNPRKFSQGPVGGAGLHEGYSVADHRLSRVAAI